MRLRTLKGGGSSSRCHWIAANVEPSTHRCLYDKIAALPAVPLHLELLLLLFKAGNLQLEAG
jgi:hypothetical protein